MTEETPRPTFRDPAGSLKLEGNFAVRTVHAASREAALEFAQSDFYRALVERGEVVASTVDDAGEGLRLLHPRMAVPSYPWEWAPAQWMDAAELTLRLCEQALDEGRILKDATPLNVLFDGARPVLVDVLSFERHEPGDATWLAYGQYVRTFLLPLVANKLLRWPMELSLFRRDGYEPAELYAALGWGKRLSPSALWPVTLPAWLEKKRGDAVTAKPAAKDPGLALHLLKKTLAGLRKRTQKAVARGAESEWASYDSTRCHYTAEESAAKFAWVKSSLEAAQPARVLDVGANTGEFSALAASLGAEVVALERDAEAADRLHRMARGKSLRVQTIHADLARPTPAAGWENAEQSSLLARLEAKFDMVMMLAVIHHLILMEQIPIAAIVELAERLTRRYWIVEWVPATDPMYKSLMRGRDDLYGALTEEDLLSACAGRFAVREREELGNGRVLFLMEVAG
jgi:FkbM family methyltransferase